MIRGRLRNEKNQLGRREPDQEREKTPAGWKGKENLPRYSLAKPGFSWMEGVME